MSEDSRQGLYYAAALRLALIASEGLRGSVATHGCDGMGLIDGMLLSGIRVLLIHTAPIRELSLDVLCGMASD